jgi:hypothetical protein
MNMSDDIAPYIPGLSFMYNAIGHSDYQTILDTINGYPIFTEMKDKLLQRFPQPGCTAPAHWDDDTSDEDFTEAFATDPVNPGQLSKFQNHGWMDKADPDSYRESVFFKEVQRKIGISDQQVLEDIRENTIHILGRCNNPRDWGEINRQGLVYGMVQSGKTASMINLISMGIIAGYKLFIILAGDKDSLRKQTQKRINDAFNLQNGLNTITGIHSPTFKNDFGHTDYNYTGTFKTQKMLRENKQYVTIIVMKKETHHLNDLIQQIDHLDQFCQRNERYDLAENFPTLIMDDEADYASLDTNQMGEKPSTINADLVKLRETLPRNCYAAYTATPQGCLGSNPNHTIGYPRDFFWLLEPFVDEINGQEVTRSYLGAWDVFWQYDEFLLNKIGRNEWPHYEKDDQGRDLGIWYPGFVDSEGTYEDERSNDESQKLFLEQVRDGSRTIPPSLTDALIDFILGAGIKWWSYWNKKDTTGVLPSLSEVSSSYPHHAIMVHLSRLVEHQLIARRIVEIAWEKVKIDWNTFDLENSPTDHPFMKKWADQKYRTSRLKPERAHMPYSEFHHFMQIALVITEQPIRQDVAPYNKYPGSPYTYLINSGDHGMILYYDDAEPWEIKTKRAAIIVGGQILSRGLTIEGLSVSFFGRTAKMPMGDTVLQMGRWFGHKKSYIDLISIYMQDGLRILFRHIADSDRYLRAQIKDAIFRNLRPDEILVELRNSPQFKATSPSKSKFVNFQNATGYSGRRALLREPTFSHDAIKANNARLKIFELQYRTRLEEVHNRAYLYRNIPTNVVISLLNDLKCKNTATQDSFSDYARFLKDWVNGENLPHIPKINIAIMKNRLMRRKRELSVSKPVSSKQARDAILGRYGAIIGGEAHGSYRGDYFLDKDSKWHEENDNAKGSYVRKYGEDDILIVFYGLQPNYVRNRLFDPTDTDEKNPLGKWRHELVELQPGDRFYIETPEGQELDHSVLIFAGFTPRGGPQYGLGVNSLLDPSKIKQRGLANFHEEELEGDLDE